jgi:hypothetical protein
LSLIAKEPLVQDPVSFRMADDRSIDVVVPRTHGHEPLERMQVQILVVDDR